MEVLEAIKTRRSIRRYKPDVPDHKTMEAVLDAGRWAPSWSNTQCWRFIVVRDADLKEKLADTMCEVTRNDSPAENPAARAMREAPMAIVVCAELGISGRFSGKPVTDKNEWHLFDVALAMENMALAAHSLGLGTVIVGAFDAARAAELLELPENICAVAMTPIGFPAREGKAPPRKELSEILSKNKYGG